MIGKSCGVKSVYAILSTLPIGQNITVALDYTSLEGTWAGFEGDLATIISPVDQDTMYIPLNNIRGITVH
ncbi:hypothetical protein SAMN05216378_0618 [Paenibacillus catalpae]|uniref:Uncharacterized protein n=1 Tax=Paenibacillus catalpae TaxID=1045775 RepID=A0A1I1TPI9_9BACL|nr:hypothetical protein [Paenibacillus catalpae]SFD60541.1 hypothetical protein SAMN05216378_0618 [Paenibacillus catalpae]